MSGNIAIENLLSENETLKGLLGMQDPDFVRVAIRYASQSELVMSGNTAVENLLSENERLKGLFELQTARIPKAKKLTSRLIAERKAQVWKAKYLAMKRTKRYYQVALKDSMRNHRQLALECADHLGVMQASDPLEVEME
ncbi:hypothetical protein NP233_g8017 [Leucocoprinus birnbaumii]|uniref:Uncharacterized protein n=1 Tax=Leucocoprinus birnbaumii TaxID=56174 RepID=A0AAD5VN11_9AGAR|nr:hypothetical protein NP233_g8017 [Leucocoprinus birnbaumii]